MRKGANKLTAEDREVILNREVLGVEDVQRLLGLSLGQAYEVIRMVKSKSDRLGLSGVIMVEDYIDYFKLDMRRYLTTTMEEQAKRIAKLVINELGGMNDEYAINN